MNFPYRYIARIIIEAQTPLAVGTDNLLAVKNSTRKKNAQTPLSGNDSLVVDQDKPVQLDFNGLPMIPGTAITGFLTRKLGAINFGKTFEESDINNIGSNIIVSDALLFDGTKVNLSLALLPDTDFYKKFKTLPRRQHTAHTHKAAGKDGSLFNNEVVYKGSRFKFEISLELNKADNEYWEKALNEFLTNDFNLGAGEFDGYGQMKIVEIKHKKFDLTKAAELNNYLDNYSVDLNEGDFDEFKYKQIENKYFELAINDLTGADSFFHFGSGKADANTKTNYKEYKITWKEDVPIFIECFVVPGTSIKGTLAHRTAFHVNKNKGLTIETLLEHLQQENAIEITDIDKIELPETVKELSVLENQIKEQLNKIEKYFEMHTGSNLPEIAEIFGKAKSGDDDAGKAGNIIISDIFLPVKDVEEINFQHNKIDRYTQGTIGTALFGEKVLVIGEFKLLLKGDKTTIENPEFNKALEELKTGQLPIGGLSNKGHGQLKQKLNHV